MEFLFIVFGSVIAIFFLVLYSGFAWGFVCYHFWYWFLLPIFPNLPQVTFLQCVGLLFFISLFKNNSSVQIKKEFQDNPSTFLTLILAPWMALLVGYFFRSLIY
jgi:hypothetical protein